jgi:uncharacterized protein (DUF58 family)
MMFPSMQDLLLLRGQAQELRLLDSKASQAHISGSHRSAQRGRGLEFQEVRLYVSGDDPRTIDWRVTARRGRPHTKLFREERERPVWLLVDLDAGMFFGSRVQLKSTLAVRSAALLAWSAVLGGDRVGGVVVGSTSLRVVPPRAREAGVLPLLSALVDVQPRAPSEPSANSVGKGLQALVPLVHPGSLVLVLSDFANLEADPAGDWAALSVHNDLRLFWITDPLEREALPNGRFRIGLPGRSLSLDGASTRAAWTARWRQREDRIEGLARRARAPVIRLDTSETDAAVQRELLSGRRTAA